MNCEKCLFRNSRDVCFICEEVLSPPANPDVFKVSTSISFGKGLPFSCSPNVPPEHPSFRDVPIYYLLGLPVFEGDLKLYGETFLDPYPELRRLLDEIERARE